MEQVLDVGSVVDVSLERQVYLAQVLGGVSAIPIWKKSIRNRNHFV